MTNIWRVKRCIIIIIIILYIIQKNKGFSYCDEKYTLVVFPVYYLKKDPYTLNKIVLPSQIKIKKNCCLTFQHFVN